VDARRKPSAELWTDARLAALAQAHDVEMVTFDRGFRSCSKLLLHLLELADAGARESPSTLA